MRKADCLRWAKALINGKHKKIRGRMSDVNRPSQIPTAMCCLGVANEVFKVRGYEGDRTRGTAIKLWEEGVFKNENPLIFGTKASGINDIVRIRIRIPQVGLVNKEMTHEDIGMLLLFALESGEYKNI